MKKAFTRLLTLLLLVAISVTLFSCKEETPDPPSRTVAETLSAEIVELAIEKEGDRVGVAEALLSLLRDTGLEEGEIEDALTALKTGGEEIAPALIALKNKSYSTADFSSIRTALQLVANGVTPEAAGEVYYTAAVAVKSDLPYTRSDCKKIAAFLFAQNELLNEENMNRLSTRDFDGLNEKEINTALGTLASSLKSMIGISAGAKDYLYSLEINGLHSLLNNRELSDDFAEVTSMSESLFIPLLRLIRDHYDLTLTYLSEYLSFSDTKIFLGYTFEKQDTTCYYGYRYADWSVTAITEEEYLAAQPGIYDEYILRNYPMKGYYDQGEFIGIPDRDIALAEKSLRFYAAYQAYMALTEEEKGEFLQALEEIFPLLRRESAFLASLLERELITPSDEPGASFEELTDAFARLAIVDGNDGLNAEEKEAAREAQSALESYLHGYLPEIY